MKLPKGLYFLLNILFILAIGYMLAPLPSAQSIAREWVVRIEQQVSEFSQFDKEQQVQALKSLIKEGKVSFDKEEHQRGRELVSLIQKQFTQDMKNSRIDQFIGILHQPYFEALKKGDQSNLVLQGDLGGSFYVLGNRIDQEDKGIHYLPLEKAVDFDAYYVITSRSGKKFLFTIESSKQKLDLQFLLVTHPDSRSKIQKVRPHIPDEIFQKEKSK